MVLAVPAMLIGAHPHGVAAWLRFSGVSVSVALLASIVGNALWNRMSRLLLLTFVGQMILAETLFALLYGFIWEHRGPSSLEGAAIVLLMASVFFCVSAHRPTAPVAAT